MTFKRRAIEEFLFHSLMFLLTIYIFMNNVHKFNLFIFSLDIVYMPDGKTIHTASIQN